jgi:hypothetical protein
MQYRLPIVIIIFNDAAYGAEVQFSREMNLSDSVSKFADVDFAPVAEAFGYGTQFRRSGGVEEDVFRLVRSDPDRLQSEWRCTGSVHFRDHGREKELTIAGVSRPFAQAILLELPRLTAPRQLLHCPRSRTLGEAHCFSLALRV